MVKISDDINIITKEIVEDVLELFKEKVYKIVLYGSYARGDFHEDSDIDVMILVKLSETEIKQVASAIYNMAYDIELEKGIHISVVIKNEEQFEYWVDTLPFYRNVSKEGVEINAG